MSIEIIGQEKYNFQDLVCVYILLIHQGLPVASFLVEPENGEDAEIHFQNGLKIEVQVKGAEQPVTLKSIAQMLSHFQNKTDLNCLLERIHSENKNVLFVMTGRCDDKAKAFLKPLQTNICDYTETKLPKKYQDELKKSFFELPWKETNLFQKRKKRFEEFVNKEGCFSSAFERIHICENIKIEELKHLITSELQSNFYVSPDRTYNAIKRLTDLVVKGKRSGCIFNSFSRELAHLSGNSLFPDNYVKRSDEAYLLQEVRDKNVLLLSGTPRSGKTTTAKYIASKLQRMGVDSKIVASIVDAERLLLDPSSHTKLVILDDPFEQTQNISQDWHRLCLLLEKANGSRKLIVSQPQEKILEYNTTDSLKRCSISGYCWYDISDLKFVFLKDLWLQLCLRHSISEQIKSIILNYLSKHLIEPGCLTHLASNINSFSGDMNEDDLMRFARQDASKFYGILKSKDLDTLTFILSISTTPLTGITELDLAFLLSSDEELPSKNQTYGEVISLGDDGKFEPPRYSVHHEVVDLYEGKINSLDEMNVIFIDEEDVFNFSHSFYRSAAEQYIFSFKKRKAKKVLDYINKGLFCANPRVASSVASNLGWIISELSKLGFSKEIFQLTYEGLGSRYPAVQDICFAHLVDNIKSLPEELGELQTLVSKVTYEDYNQLYWQEEHAVWGPYRFMQRHRLVDNIEDFAHSFSEKEDVYYPPEIIFSIIDYFSTDPKKYNLNSLHKFMTYPEAIIRSKAISVWMRTKDICQKSSQLIFSHKHPRTSVEILKGAFGIWKNLKEDEKSVFTNGLSQVASTPESAISMLSILAKAYKYDSSDTSSWELFSKVLPSVLVHLPTEARLNGSSLYTSISDSIGKVDGIYSINICKAWLNQLERRLSIGMLPGDYELGVADIIIQATVQEPQLREGLVQDIFEINSLPLQLVSFKDLIYSWEVLSKNEKKLLLNLAVESEKKDWFVSTLLTFKDMPSEYYDLIETVKFFSDNSVKEIKNNLPFAILQKAVQIHCGDPQPLWWIGLHHHDSKKMNSLIWEIASDLEHPLCDICWQEITLSGSRDDEIAMLISTKSVEDIDVILNLLLKKKLNCVGDFMPQSWAALFSLATSEEKKETIVDKLDEFLPIILEDISDLSLWIEDKELWPLFLTKLKLDYQYIHLLKYSKDIEQENIIQFFQILCGDALPRLHGTCGRLIEYFNRLGLEEPNALIELLQEHREKIIYSKSHDMSFSIPALENWSDS